LIKFTEYNILSKAVTTSNEFGRLKALTFCHCLWPFRWACDLLDPYNNKMESYRYTTPTEYFNYSLLVFYIGIDFLLCTTGQDIDIKWHWKCHQCYQF